MRCAFLFLIVFQHVHSDELICAGGNEVFIKDAAKAEEVKSVDVHPRSGRTILSQRGATLRLFSPEGKITFSDTRPYKVRWMP